MIKANDALQNENYSPGNFEVRNMKKCTVCKNVVRVAFSASFPWEYKLYTHLLLWEIVISQQYLSGLFQFQAPKIIVRAIHRTLLLLSRQGWAGWRFFLQNKIYIHKNATIQATSQCSKAKKGTEFFKKKKEQNVTTSCASGALCSEPWNRWVCWALARMRSLRHNRLGQRFRQLRAGSVLSLQLRSYGWCARGQSEPAHERTKERSKVATSAEWLVDGHAEGLQRTKGERHWAAADRQENC